jgi:hypothetical protein
VHLPAPDEPIVGAAAVHALLMSWRETLRRTSSVTADADRDRRSRTLHARA